MSPACSCGAPRPPWRRYVAIGDSFTEGLADEDPQRPGGYLGWADRLAEHLARHAGVRGDRVEYANLAVRGRLLDDIAGRQVDLALDLHPDLVSIVGGGNDLLRPRFDIDRASDVLDRAVARIRRSGADVLMATPVDPREAPLVRRLRGRMAGWTAAIWSVANRHGAYVIDQWSLAALRDARIWAPDRIHLTPEGHRRVALAALAALGLAEPEAGQWAAPLETITPPTRWQSARETAAWGREYLGPWVRRRLRHESSGDRVEPKRPLPRAIGERDWSG